MSDPRVALVILTHDRLAEVRRSVHRALALPERPRIVVVDNASSDGTAVHLTREFPRIEVIALGDNRGAAGRNVGVVHAERPYVALSDDDTWWAPGSLARGADLLDAAERLAVVSARVLVGEAEREDPACALMARSPLPRIAGLPGIPILGFLAGASIVRRSAFLDAGGFEPRLFLGGEEALLAVDLAAAGWRMAYVADLVAHHHPSHVRDVRARRRLLVRNALWLAWLRRPLPAALRQSLRLAGACRLDNALVAALRTRPAGRRGCAPTGASSPTTWNRPSGSSTAAPDGDPSSWHVCGSASRRREITPRSDREEPRP
jgi:GT2 family glycosyltransferase